MLVMLDIHINIIAYMCMYDEKNPNGNELHKTFAGC